jgi:transposase-like protein
MTILDFEQRFRTEEACREHLANLRWPDGFKCPLCGNSKAWKARRGLLHCGKCRADISVTAGTIFHRSRIPLRAWFRAAWWITNQKSGISALGLQRLLGLGSYRTAWVCLHKLRQAMIRPGRERLCGSVELDETLLGGTRKGKFARQGKTIVGIAVEVRGEGSGRVRLKRLTDVDAASIRTFVQATVEPGSTLLTDGWPAYRKATADYSLHPTPLKGHGREASAIALPRVHRIASLLKRWLLGTFQGRFTDEKLDYYLEEFAFRFNRRSSASRGMLFHRLLQQCVASRPPLLRSTE